MQLRNFFHTTVGHVEERVMPSKEYLKKKLQEVENGEFRAETLAEVVSKDEIDPDVLVPVFDSKGSLSVKKGSTTVPLTDWPRTASPSPQCHAELFDVGAQTCEPRGDPGCWKGCLR